MLCMSAGWGDAAILVPYALYQRTGDRKILADNYQMMQKWYAFLLGRAQQTTEEQQTGEYAQYTVLNGLDYGEWCEPGITPMQAMMNPAKAWVRPILRTPADCWQKSPLCWANRKRQRSIVTQRKSPPCLSRCLYRSRENYLTASVNMSVPLRSVCWMKLRAKPLRIR